MSALDRPLRAADDFQRRHPVLAFAVGVWVKFRDDKAGNLAALIAYYAFAALFPLLLLLATVLEIVLRNDPELRSRLLNSALSQYPVIGPQIKASLGSIPGSGLPLVIGALLLLFGARGVARAMQNALCEVWGIPADDRPRFPLSLLGGIALVLVIGLGFTVTTSLSGLASGAGHLIGGAGAAVGAVAIALVLNFGVFWLGFRIATGLRIGWHDLRTGAAIGAVSWQVLQFAGGYVVSHQLHRASELYGTFGLVLGLLTWLFVQAEVTLYAAEVDVVLARRLWPRSVRPAGRPHKAAAHGQGDGQQAVPAAATEAGPAARPRASPDPGPPAGAEVPPPRGPDERARHACEKETARWISRARRAVGRR